MRPTLRSEHRQSQSLRVDGSPTLAVKFAELKALTVDFTYLDAAGTSRNRRIKHVINIERARSVLLVECLNPYCIRGDFDLSEVIARAVAVRERRVLGQMRCQGWLDGASVGRVHCHQQISFTITIDYRPASDLVHRRGARERDDPPHRSPSGDSHP
jgi:hypothetical protein